MAWLNLNQSFNSLKGQITNFATEVLSEVPGQESGDEASNQESSLSQLQEKCQNQELEIAALRQLSDELQASLQSERLARQNGVKEEESTWYWDPPPQTSNTAEKDDSHYKVQIRALQDEISAYKRDTVDIRPNTEEEIRRLREENKNLTTNLEDLDNQHQIAMERLLSLKKELLHNFETLKQDHVELKSVNEEYAEEIRMLQEKMGDKARQIDDMKAVKSDYDTLHHKYQNLERIYALLRENAEKFQEENQELHEEVFKLQEQVTKLEHDLEVMAKNAEVQTTVPKELYDDVLRELNELRDRRNANQIHLDEINIDDNAKSVIENLKREINDLRHQLNQKEDGQIEADHKIVKTDKIMQLYNKYVDFEIPLDFVGEIPSVGDNLVIYKLESVFKTINSFKKDIDSLENQVAHKNHNINQLQDQIDELTTENDFLTTDIQHYEKEVNSMKKNNDFLISELTSLKNTSKLEPIIETNHEDNLAKLETELADCNKVNKTFESEIKKIETELAEVRKEKTVLQESLNDLRTKYTTMLSEVEMCKNKSEAAEKLEQTVHKQQNVTIKSDNDQMEDLKKKLALANSQNEQLSIDKHILENDKVLLTKQVDDLKNTIEKKANAHKELEILKLALDNKLHDFEIKLDEVILHKNEIEFEKSELENKVRLLEDQSAHKNNDEYISGQNISLNENLHRLHNEKVYLTEALTKAEDKMIEVQKVNNELRDQIEKLKENINISQDSKSNQTEVVDKESKNNQTDGINQETKKNQTDLNQASKNSQTDHHNEVDSLKANLKHLEEKNIKLETELFNTDAKIVNLEQEFEKMLKDIDEKDELIDALNITISDDKLSIDSFNKTVTELKQTLHEKDKHIESLKQNTELLTRQLEDRSKLLENELTNVQNITRKTSDETDTLKQEIAHKNSEISKLVENAQKLKVTIENKDKEIKELNQSLIEIKDRNKTPENVHQNDDYAHLILEKETAEKEVIILKHNITTHDKVITELKNNITRYENTISEYEKSKKETDETMHQMRENIRELEELRVDYKTIIDNAASEKAELLKYLNAKHNESMLYHGEIQRLNQVLQERENAFKLQLEEQENLHGNVTGNCANCENLRTTLKEKDSIIKTLNQNTAELERLKVELANAGEVVRNLTEKCDAVETNLSAQLEVAKKLLAEKAQLAEQEENSAKELERLRRHLVETEESYTQELMTSEQKLTECQTRLHTIEERAKQTSTVYTSNSIRANQEVETLRTQIKLLEKQREEVQAKLSSADDARRRSEAALTNLQIVLEQFQMEKEREIEAATEKIRNKMEEIKRQNMTLQDEISRLNTKLEESKAGLQAASRLGDQLETKTAQMNDLKEQVKTLQTSVAAAEERYYNAISNQQDKVDKNLVKNLIINYVLTAANSKLQVLRILSTVLDFNQQECAKLGLTRPAAPDSLAAEFVKFLQSESTPRVTPSLPPPSAGPSRRSSTTGPNPTFNDATHKRNPSTASTGSNNLLFAGIDNIETSSQVSRDSVELRQTLDTGVNQTRNNEGAILKHVLRDM